MELIILGFIAGFFIGIGVGIFLTALCIAQKGENDEQ